MRILLPAVWVTCLSICYSTAQLHALRKNYTIKLTASVVTTMQTPPSILQTIWGLPLQSIFAKGWKSKQTCCSIPHYQWINLKKKKGLCWKRYPKAWRMRTSNWSETRSQYCTKDMLSRCQLWELTPLSNPCLVMMCTISTRRTMCPIIWF